ncbi:hypothetical protein DZF91_10340 [Actinomadura logoneensis]|uniref:Uncharacterized protein n=1 Tax=Actinomadura logoneensis TaxID=2293572 RepID=A0A372JNX7_9ACTN|nr:hypothetical protein [Actinomadura logoneensis]RFU41733.1 hypothetical protein DZF91_10340 [Actinomadura logoneensis]
MNLSDRQRKIVFGVLVVVLAAVGVYLTVASPTRHEPSHRTARPAPVSGGGPAAPASPPQGITAQVNAGNFDIYRLLPFSQQEFATAADTAQKFVAAYGTYRFDEQPDAYAARLRPLVSEQVAQQVAQGFAAPGIRQQRQQEQTVASCTATLDQVRDIGNNSIIFLVTGKQRITKAGGGGDDSKQWAVTVARDGNALKVSAFEPADVGQAGDTGGGGRG